ncbi:hypothetical protein CR513_40314, partial [Mucuna pruriens]
LLEVIARYSRRTPMDGNLNVWPSLVHHCRPSKSPRPSQSDSIVFESALSRDCVEFVSIKTKLDQSNLRVSRHSTLDQPILTNRSKSKRECESSHSKKWKTLPQLALQQLPRSADADSEPNVESQVEINIPLLDVIKQIPMYARFLKELCIHKRKKMKGSVEIGGIVSALTRNEDFAVEAQVLPKKFQDPRIFSFPCTIGDYTFADTMLDLGASTNVMPTSIYKSLNFGDLEPTQMTIQLANKSVVQPLGVLKDVLVQVNELIFPTDFYVLDMDDETLGKGSTLILG